MLSYEFLHSRIHSELTLKSESAGSIQPFPFLFHSSDIQVSIFPAISLPFPPHPHPPEGTTFSLEPREWMLMGVREENEGIICDVSAWPSGSMTPLQKTALTL